MRALPAGVTVALATPLDEHGALDEAALDVLLDRVLAGGVVGISPLGSTGEGARLSAATRRRVLQVVRAKTAVPVIAGLPVTTMDSARREVRELADNGADAILVAAPSYYPAGNDDITTLYSALAEESPAPLVIYHIPAMTGVTIAPTVIGTLAQHPNIVGMKDSSRDMEYLQAAIYAADGADFDVLTGSDTLLLASMLLGARGTIAASANLVPGLSVGICAAITAVELDRAATLQRRLFAIVQACRRGLPPSGWKAALEISGVCSARLAEPAGRLPAQEYREIERDLAELIPAEVQL